MFEDERGDGIDDVILACPNPDAAKNPIRGLFDSEIRSREKAGQEPDVRDDAVAPSRA